MRAEIITNGANLRHGAGMSYGIKDQLAAGDVVDLVSAWQINSWLAVKVAKAGSGQVGKSGFIWSAELRLLPEMIPGPPPVLPPAPPLPAPPVWEDNNFDEQDEGIAPDYPKVGRALLAIAIIIAVAVALCAIVYTVR